MANREERSVNYDDIDLRQLVKIILGDRKRLLVLTSFFSLISIGISLWLPNQYTATVVLAPAQQETGGLSTALGQLGGIASLAGVNIGSIERSESQIAQEVMLSWSFIDAFIVNNELEVEVYAVNRWLEDENTLVIDDDLFDKDSQQWLIEDESGQLRAPTSWELYEEFESRLSVSEDITTGLVTLSIDYFSPQIAKLWADMYVRSINLHMQAREVSKVNRNIEYLQNQIGKTSIAEMQEVLYLLVEEQLKAKMVAEASPDYAFITVSPSMIAEEESRPNRPLIIILLTFIGVILSSFWILFEYFNGKQ